MFAQFLKKDHPIIQFIFWVIGSKVGDRSRGRPEGPRFNSYHTWEGRYSFPWIDQLYPWYVPYITEC